MAQMIYLQQVSLLLGSWYFPFILVRTPRQSKCSQCPTQDNPPFPHQAKLRIPRLERVFDGHILQSRRPSQRHYSSPSSLRAALLAPLVLLAELLVSLILGCGVLFVVGAADVSFCDEESSSSFSSGCSCSCF